jgi:peptide chain release factor 1
MLDKISGIEHRYDEINKELMEVGENYQRATELSIERADIEPIVEKARAYRQVQAQLEDAQSMLESETDEELRMLAEAEINELSPKLDTLEGELKNMLLPKDPRDNRNVIMEIRAGTGGDEAAIFAADLFRMYNRYAERHKWNVEVLSASDIGIGAYSRLKYESGVHRVQRVPVTEAQGRIHTSTSTVAVLAEVDEVEINIPDSDIRMEVYKSAGAGGQNVQKNATAVRLIHLPTGMVVQCQDERSQLQNRMRAMSILRARLYDIEAAKRLEEIDSVRRSQVGSGERSEKIRTYNFPQSRVTDHRINVSNFNIASVMDGNIDEFIDELATRDESDRLSAVGENDDED